MLYETHKRYGQVAGILMFPVALNIGIVDADVVSSSESGLGNVLLGTAVVAFYLITALKASMFGAEFPDLDSPGSTPAKNHKIIAGIFKLFKVKHRGKFSHDILTQSVFWGIIYGIVSYFGSGLGDSELGIFLLGLVKTYVFFTYIGVLSHLVADAMTSEGVWFAFKIKVNFMPVFIKKVGFGGFRPFKNWFNTSTSWNDVNYKMMTVLVPIVSVLTGIQLIINL